MLRVKKFLGGDTSGKSKFLPRIKIWGISLPFFVLMNLLTLSSCGKSQSPVTSHGKSVISRVHWPMNSASINFTVGIVRMTTLGGNATELLLLKCQRYWLQHLHFTTISSLAGHLDYCLSVYREKRNELCWMCIFNFLRQNSGISSHFIGKANVTASDYTVSTDNTVVARTWGIIL